MIKFVKMPASIAPF